MALHVLEQFQSRLEAIQAFTQDSIVKPEVKKMGYDAVKMGYRVF